MSGLINKVKEALTGKEDTREAEAANHGASGTSSHHGHGHTGAGTTGSGHNISSTTAGPHSSSMANKADPRVDSDLDGSRTAGMSSTSGSGMTGGTSGSSGYGIGSSTTAGPHSSNLANKADPRVDSDLDGSRGTGMGSTSGGSGLTGGTSGSSGSGTGMGPSTTAGPHSSNLANKADPRVDSDLDGSRRAAMGSTSGGSGLTGRTSGSSGYGTGVGSSTTAGPHSSGLANKADPRVDSDLDGSRNAGMSSSGSTGSGLMTGTSTERHRPHDGHGEDIIHGGAHHTATANKLDPHVEGSGLGSTSPGLGSTSSGVGHSSSGLGNTSSGLGNTSSGLGHSSSGHGNTSSGLGSSSSEYDNSSAGYGSGNTNTNITTGTSTTTGPHKTAAMNQIDPRGDVGYDNHNTTGSDRTGASATSGKLLP